MRRRVIGSATVASVCVGLSLACTGAAVEEPPDGLPRGPLTWIDAEPDWAPDGRRIVYTRGSAEPVTDDFSVRWVDLRSGREYPITSGHNDRDPAWSPDGRTVAFVRDLDSGFCNEDDTIMLVARDARRAPMRPRRLARGCSPEWSPDGSRVAFLRDGSLVVRAGDAREVEVGPRVPLRERDGLQIPGEVFDFDWAPDSARLVFERGNELWVVGADGQGLRRLTRAGHARVAHGPRWSPDDSLILHDRGLQGLWVMRPDGTRARQIAEGEIFDRAWSPDGSRIAFSRSEPDSGLFVVERDGETLRPLWGAGGGSFGGWSPDGTRIALGGEPRKGLSPNAYPIVVIDVETRRVTRATQRPKARPRRAGT